MTFFLRTPLLFLCLLGLGLSVSAQSYSRSGFPAQTEGKPSFKREACAGDSIFSEDFNDASDLPEGFAALDLDGQTPRSAIQFLTPMGGWQVVDDFKDSTGGNRSLASPSWYQSDSVPSDDWLILPPFTDLPPNACFSFLAYSQDSLFPESYEVRVSTTGNLPGDFLANDPLLTVAAQPSDFSFQTIDLGPYAGQDIYLAIRHTSLNQFVLVIDDLRLSSVKRRDLAVFSVDTTALDFPGDTFLIKGRIINRGLDTLAFDSAGATVGYRVNNSPYYRDLIDTAFTLLPNETFAFEHVRPFVAPGFGLFYIEVIVNAMPGDEQLSNDTLVVRIPVGAVLNVTAPTGPSWTLGPNPVREQIHIDWAAPLKTSGYLQLMDLQGRQVGPGWTVNRGTLRQQLSLGQLAPGLYLLQFTTENGAVTRARIRKE